MINYNPNDFDDKVIALAEHLDIEPDEIAENSYDFETPEGDYLVLTDEEADQAWEESLDQYLEECVYPELSGHLANYFDDEAWKRDARYDGRGHCLNTYDGSEGEETVNGVTYYIYRTN